MRLIDARSGLEVLDRHDCLRLLALKEYGVGRLAVVDGLHPIILPVNYALDGDNVVFRTAAGTKLDLAVHRANVAFEVDHVDDELRSGWSVLIKGRAERVTNAHELARFDVRPQLPWAAGDRPNWVVIRPESITGRRLVSDDRFRW
jgi:uncharacterized protein